MTEKRRKSRLIHLFMPLKFVVIHRFIPAVEVMVRVAHTKAIVSYFWRSYHRIHTFEAAMMCGTHMRISVVYAEIILMMKYNL